MDELEVVRQLLAERPPPTAGVVAAARASLERAGLNGAPGAKGLNGWPIRQPHHPFEEYLDKLCGQEKIKGTCHYWSKQTTQRPPHTQQS